MTDPRTAALAEALTDLFPAVQRDRWPFTPEQAAAAILAALPANFLCGHLAHDEFARLRRIEKAARALLAAHDDGHFEGWFGAKADDPVAALRAALEDAL